MSSHIGASSAAGATNAAAMITNRVVGNTRKGYKSKMKTMSVWLKANNEEYDDEEQAEFDEEGLVKVPIHLTMLSDFFGALTSEKKKGEAVGGADDDDDDEGDEGAGEEASAAKKKS